jgi:single-stranded DNA-binding protein
VEDWMLKKNSEWLYSLENICETLQLNADYIRKGLRVWKEANLKSDSVEDQRKDHTKLARTHVAPNVARLSKTAQILMREYHLETSGAIDWRTRDVSAEQKARKKVLDNRQRTAVNRAGMRAIKAIVVYLSV